MSSPRYGDSKYSRKLNDLTFNVSSWWNATDTQDLPYCYYIFKKQIWNFTIKPAENKYLQERQEHNTDARTIPVNQG